MTTRKRAAELRADTFWVASFGLLSLVSLLTVLSCRIFTSQDGHLHLYYAEAARNLLLGTGRFSSGFVISHFLTPYILQTYILAALAALDEILDPLLSEKLLVSAYLMAEWLPTNLRSVLQVLAAHATIIWVMRFTTNDHNLNVGTVDIAQRLKDHLAMWSLSAMRTRHWRWTLMMVVGLAVAAIGSHLLRRLSVSKRTLSLLSTSALRLALSLFAPPRLDGGTNIARRFACYGFIFLVIASAEAPVREPLLRSLGVVALGTALVLLWRAGQKAILALTPFFEAQPAAAESKMFWIVDLKTRIAGELNSNQGYWIAANDARASQAILENNGWLYLSYMNLRPRVQSACTFTKPAEMEACLQSQANRARPDGDLILTEGVHTTAVASLYDLSAVPPAGFTADSDFHFFAKRRRFE